MSEMQPDHYVSRPGSPTIPPGNVPNSVLPIDK